MMPQFTPDQAVEIALQFHKANNLAEAERLYRQILAQSPGNASALHLLGRLLASSGRREEGISLLRRSIAAAPGVGAIHGNLGNVLSDAGRFEEAIVEFSEAIRLNPSSADAFNNLGNAFADLNRYGEALAAYGRALAIRPDLAEAHKGAGISLLTIGDYEAGFREYEWRWRAPSFTAPRHQFAKPPWRGEELRGRTVLLDAEQGIGDTIQFIRYAPLIHARGGRVVVGCMPDLVRLLARMPEIAEIATQSPLPHFDLHIAMMSLPLAFRTTMQTIPAIFPYLTADPALTEYWRHAIDPDAGKLKVGLAWAGSAAHAGDARRSISLGHLAPLARTPGVHFYSLQKGPPAQQADRPPPGMMLSNPATGFGDLADTAAFIAHLDLVIAVDTAVAHLAGAMGKPTWVLLPHKPDWRWMLEREDSVWYPSIRLFRQKTAGDWAPVIERAARELPQLAAAKQNADSPPDISR